MTRLEQSTALLEPTVADIVQEWGMQCGIVSGLRTKMPEEILLSEKKKMSLCRSNMRIPSPQRDPPFSPNSRLVGPVAPLPAAAQKEGRGWRRGPHWPCVIDREEAGPD